MESERTYPRLDILKFVCDVNCGFGGKDCRCPIKHVDAEDKSNLMCAAKSSNHLVSICTNPFSKLQCTPSHGRLLFLQGGARYEAFVLFVYGLFLESWAGV